MKKLILSGFLSLVSSLALAGVGPISSMTPVQADYRCEDRTGGFAFKVPYDGTTALAKVWQTFAESNMGYELKVKGFAIYRCPGCFRFHVEASQGVELEGRSMTDTDGMFLSVLTLTPEGSQEIGRYPCKKQ